MLHSAHFGVDIFTLVSTTKWVMQHRLMGSGVDTKVSTTQHRLIGSGVDIKIALRSIGPEARVSRPK